MADKPTATPPQAQAPTEDELRELVMHGEALRQQMGGLEQQRDLVAELAQDARRSLLALDALSTAKDGDEMLVPLGAGAFVHARLAGAGTAVASLGAGLHAEMPVADARGRLQARVESLEGASSQIAKEVSRVAEELQRVNAVVERYYGG